MNYEEKYPNVYQFFGYFHQDWMNIYKWEGRKPNYQSVIREYKVDYKNVDKTVSELKDILKIGKGLNEEEWLEILTWKGLGLCYYPPGDNLTYENWLEDVLNILEEPMEETLKHWIPKRIRE